MYACHNDESAWMRAGKFRFRFEGHVRPPANKSNPGWETGYIFTDDKYFSWVKATSSSRESQPIASSSPESTPIDDRRDVWFPWIGAMRNRELGSDIDEASGAWALKKTKVVWDDIAHDKGNIPKRMRICDNVAVDVRVVLGRCDVDPACFQEQGW